MATKRQFDKETILNSTDIEQAIMNNIATAMRKMWQFSFVQHGNNRSSAKTDLLHKSWENVLKDSFGDYQDLFVNNFGLVVEKENTGSKKTQRIKQIVDIFGSKFKVDMLMTHNENIHTVFLLKAPLTSINKNRYNSVLNNFGEIDRFYGNPENKDIELVFVNLTPRESFVIEDKKKSIKNENVQYLGLNQDDNGNRPIDKLPKEKSVKDKVHEIHIDYSLNFGMELKDIKTKLDLINKIQNTQNFVSLSNGSIEELKTYIDYFIKTNNHIFNLSQTNSSIPIQPVEDENNNIVPAGTQMKFKF